jgi:hypothetical protein
MDADRFDSVAKSVGRSATRRLTLRTLLGGTLGLLGLAETTAKGKKRKKRCGSCKRRNKQGRCRPKPNDAVCEGSGKCLNGTCNPQPTCKPTDTVCTTNTECCSGSCPGATLCAKGGAGTPCFGGNDCTSGNCIGFRCQ